MILKNILSLFLLLQTVITFSSEHNISQRISPFFNNNPNSNLQSIPTNQSFYTYILMKTFTLQDYNTKLQNENTKLQEENNELRERIKRKNILLNKDEDFINSLKSQLNRKTNRLEELESVYKKLSKENIKLKRKRSNTTKNLVKKQKNDDKNHIINYNSNEHDWVYFDDIDKK